MLKCILASPSWWEISTGSLPKPVECNVDINIHSSGFARLLDSLAHLDDTEDWAILDYLGLSLLAFFGAAQKMNRRSPAASVEATQSLRVLIDKMSGEDSAKLSRKGKGRAGPAAANSPLGLPPSPSGTGVIPFEELVDDLLLEDTAAGGNNVDDAHLSQVGDAGPVSAADGDFLDGDRQSSTPWADKSALASGSNPRLTMLATGRASRESSVLSDPPSEDELGKDKGSASDNEEDAPDDSGTDDGDAITLRRSPGTENVEEEAKPAKKLPKRPGEDPDGESIP